MKRNIVTDHKCKYALFSAHENNYLYPTNKFISSMHDITAPFSYRSVEFGSVTQEIKSQEIKSNHQNLHATNAPCHGGAEGIIQIIATIDGAI